MLRPIAVLCALVAACSGGGGGKPGPVEPATLALTVRDAATGAATPARVQLLDEQGVGLVPPTVLPVGGECDGTPPPSGPLPRPGGVLDPTTGTLHFYVAGPTDFPLGAGRYRLTVAKGLEYTPQTVEVVVAAGERREVEVALTSWADLSAAGWFSADDHLHIARPSADVDPLLVDWMRAEDLDVANLLQMGSARGVVAARQHAFGETAVHQDGGTIIAPAQENPRAWVLGHGIILGARSYLDAPDRYLPYGALWDQARAHGAVTGYAHWGGPGLFLDAPFDRIDFLEVLQFDVAEPAALYDLWNLNLRIAPTAGTDFPCWPAGPPGSQRFYTRVDGDLGYAAWLEGVRRGRTFVTNGPLLELTVGGAEIGDELRLTGPGEVQVAGAVRFDPGRDDVTSLELIREGEVVHTEEVASEPGVIRLELVQFVERSTWLALRAIGTKVDALPALDGSPRTSAAQTGAVWVDVAGSPSLAERPRAAETSQRILADLARLAERFTPEAIDAIRGPAAEAVLGIDAAVARRDRTAVLEAIEQARDLYAGIAARDEGKDREDREDRREDP